MHSLAQLFTVDGQIKAFTLSRSGAGKTLPASFAALLSMSVLLECIPVAASSISCNLFACNMVHEKIYRKILRAWRRRWVKGLSEGDRRV